jgi:tetratricopeptide (TPR) repeat protein
MTMAAPCDDQEGTLTAFNKLRSRAPDLAISSESVIQSLLKVGKHDLAKSVIEEGLRKYPNLRPLLQMHGVIAQYQRDWPEMARRFELMRRKFPDEVWGYVLGGVALRQLGQFNEADKLLARAIAMDPLFPHAAFEYARLAELVSPL